MFLGVTMRSDYFIYWFSCVPMSHITSCNVFHMPSVFLCVAMRSYIIPIVFSHVKGAPVYGHEFLLSVYMFPQAFLSFM